MRQNRAMGCDLRDLDVVFVDDARQDQAIMRSILTAARVARIRGFASAEEAHHAMLIEPPHVVVTDYEMPVADGLELVRSMRDPRAGPLTAVPVILVAGTPTRMVVERSIALGVHHVVAKPLSPVSVIRRLESIVRDSRQFVLDEATGRFVLQDCDRLLDVQRKRWNDLLDGVRAFPKRRDAMPQRRDAPPQVEEAVEEPRRRGPLHGLGAPMRRAPGEPVEGATGQRLGRTA